MTAEHPCLSRRRGILLEQISALKQFELRSRHRDVADKGRALRLAALLTVTQLNGFEFPTDAILHATAQTAAAYHGCISLAGSAARAMIVRLSLVISSSAPVSSRSKRVTSPSTSKK